GQPLGAVPAHARDDRRGGRRGGGHADVRDRLEARARDRARADLHALALLGSASQPSTAPSSATGSVRAVRPVGVRAQITAYSAARGSGLARTRVRRVGRRAPSAGSSIVIVSRGGQDGRTTGVSGRARAAASSALSGTG